MPQGQLWSAINISEGRRVETLGQLADALSSAGVNLADWSADADHNRSVFSLVGDQLTLLAGLRVVFSWAAKHIDLSRHQGQHPRLGAVDVVPFAPLGTTDMESARQAARACATVISEEFSLPIFLYRESSLDKALPVTLPFLRKGGLTGLSARLAEKEIRQDFGPDIPHPTLGVSVFGARPPLVAYNCVLDTTDLEVGKKVAARVRESGGGPAGLQALAFPLAARAGAVQISMNILEPAKTPPHLAYLEVDRVAAEYGAQVVSSELIGLVPEEALREAFRHFLKLDDLRPNQIAERNLCQGDKIDAKS